MNKYELFGKSNAVGVNINGEDQEDLSSEEANILIYRLLGTDKLSVIPHGLQGLVLEIAETESE